MAEFRHLAAASQPIDDDRQSQKRHHWQQRWFLPVGLWPLGLSQAAAVRRSLSLQWEAFAPHQEWHQDRNIHQSDQPHDPESFQGRHYQNRRLEQGRDDATVRPAHHG